MTYFCKYSLQKYIPNFNLIVMTEYALFIFFVVSYFDLIFLFMISYLKQFPLHSMKVFVNTA